MTKLRDVEDSDCYIRANNVVEVFCNWKSSARNLKKRSQFYV